VCCRSARCAGRLKLLTQTTDQLVARVDVELAEDLTQAVGNGVRADEQLGCDLGVRFAVRSELRGLMLLRRELIAGFALFKRVRGRSYEQCDPRPRSGDRSRRLTAPLDSRDRSELIRRSNAR
jgi:dihydropteroate synthase